MKEAKSDARRTKQQNALWAKGLKEILEKGGPEVVLKIK